MRPRPHSRRAVLAVWLLLTLLAVAPTRAGGDKQDRQDDQNEQTPTQKAANLLRVASLLVKDGHLDRAAATLEEIDATTRRLDLPRYHTLRGLVALRRGDFKPAERALRAAIKAGQKDKDAWLLLAQACFGQQDYRGTLRALQQTGERGRFYPGVPLMEAQCHFRVGDKEGAWRALSAGLRRFPAHDELQRQRVLLMVDLGLYQQATSTGLRYLARGGGGDNPDGYVAIAEALRRGKQHARAILILEQARLRFPGSDDVLKQLARGYLDDGKPLAAAELLARAAHRTPAYRLEAAELYRRAGRLVSAVYLNEQATQQKGKVRQRLGLLVELERFEEAAALAPRLSRLGLLADQEIVYALAYANFKIHRFDEAERLLKRLTRPELFARAIQLRKAMDSCRELDWACD